MNTVVILQTVKMANMKLQQVTRNAKSGTDEERETLLK